MKEYSLTTACLLLAMLSGCHSSSRPQVVSSATNALIKDTTTRNVARRPNMSLMDPEQQSASSKLQGIDRTGLSQIRQDAQTKTAVSCAEASQTNVTDIPTSLDSDAPLIESTSFEANVKRADVVTPPAPKFSEAYPIDLSSALRLAGADNWNVRIANQRVREAAAEYCLARSGWLPSLNLAIGYNHHEGQLQATEGDVLKVSRSSLFVGAGAGIANSPLNGGAGGPPRMFVDFSMADAIFQPLAARRRIGAEQASQNRVINDTMLQTALAYYELVRAQSQFANAQQNLREAQQLASLTEAFTEAGKGTLVDNSRIAVVVNDRKNAVTKAESEVKIASVQLATILQLDPSKVNPQYGLVALEVDSLPVQLVDTNFDLASTIAQAQAVRCEIAEANARTRVARAEHCSERWRPWLPNLYAGYSGGLFGGGQGNDLPNLDGRSDLDIVVAWQVSNMGFGSRARQDSARSRLHRRNFEALQIKDQIAQQVTSTYHRVRQFETMVEVSRQSVEEAGSGFIRNLAAIDGLEGLPLEAIASLNQLATARNEYVAAVAQYNQWQFRLLRAAGQSLDDGSDLGEVMGCDTSGCSACEPYCSNCITKPKRCQ